MGKGGSEKIKPVTGKSERLCFRDHPTRVVFRYGAKMSRFSSNVQDYPKFFRPGFSSSLARLCPCCVERQLLRNKCVPFSMEQKLFHRSPLCGHVQATKEDLQISSTRSDTRCAILTELTAFYAKVNAMAGWVTLY